MKVKLIDSRVGPADSVMKVYIKIEDNHGEIWYIIPSSDKYHRDASPIQSSDRVLYRHPNATRESGFRENQFLPEGYTFIVGNKCLEFPDVNNNREAVFLLEKEY